VAIVVGIDEAGYGPLLGPLVVTGVAFEVPDEVAAAGSPDLWSLLSDSVTRRPSRRDLRLPVLDSKKLYQRAAGLSLLEGSALAMLQSAQPPPGTFLELLRRIAPQSRELLAQYPWYRDLDFELPVEADATAVAMKANAVRRNARAAGVRLAGVVCEPLLEGHFNRLVNSTRNKAVVLLGVTLRIVQRLLARARGRTTRVFVDRQGGRSRYLDPLMTAFAEFELEVLEESARRSAYRLIQAPSAHTVEFRTDGEDHHLPIALASIVSKYVRELFMKGLNHYWSARVAALRPTAGYYTDALRFLEDIAPAVQRERIDRDLLVRQR